MVAGAVRQMDPDGSHGESSAARVSHPGAFALDSAAGNRPETQSLFISMDDGCLRACCEIRNL